MRRRGETTQKERRPSSSSARRAARAAARISPSPCPSARSPPPSPSRSLSHQSPPPPGGPPRRASPLQAPRSSSSRPRSRSWSVCAASAAAPAGRCGWCVTAGRGGPTYALKVLYGKRGRGRSPRAAARGRARRRAAGRGRGRGWSRMAALGGAAPAMLGPSSVRPWRLLWRRRSQAGSGLRHDGLRAARSSASGRGLAERTARLRQDEGGRAVSAVVSGGTCAHVCVGCWKR